MTRILCLVHCPSMQFVGAHPEGQAWGRLEADVVDGEWVGINGYEIIPIDIDLSSPPDDVDLVCAMGMTVTVPWDDIRGYI